MKTKISSTILIVIISFFSQYSLAENKIEEKYEESISYIEKGDYPKAMIILIGLAKIEYAPALYEIWRVIYNGWFGNNSNEDIDFAYSCLYQSAALGYLKAIDWLAFEYSRIDSFAIAASYYELALEQGDDNALSYLTEWYYDGKKDLPMDRKKAFSLALEYDDLPSAKCFLAKVYSDGYIVTKDTLMANYYKKLCIESLPPLPPPPLLIE